MATVINQTKNLASIKNLNKEGSGWRYEEPDILYEMTDLYYNTFGSAITFTNQTKNSATFINQVKN